MDDLLKDLRVIETAAILAGPAVGMFFAELGARVTKIENKRAGGDPTRRWKLPSEDPDSRVSAYFSSVNWGKEHVLMDLQDPDDRGRFDALLRTADILITNHLQEDAKKLGLDRKRLRELNPTLICGHIEGFAQQPERPAFDAVLQAETGYISMTGTDREHLAKLPIAVIDVLAAHQLKEALLLALLQRSRTKQGSYVRVSLEEAALTGLINQASNQLMAGHTARPMGTLHPNIAPYGELFTCADGGLVILAVGTDRQFTRLCAVLGLDEVASETRFATNSARVRERAPLADLLATRIASKERDPLLNDLLRAGVPAGAVRSLAEVMSSPVARAMTLERAIDGQKTQRIRGNAFQIEKL
ncbi:MAG: CoA transferase [Flavobacteriales bacterium]|nr:CoA transferase [Flavobacteriales bacterium]